MTLLQMPGVSEALCTTAFVWSNEEFAGHAYSCYHMVCVKVFTGLFRKMVRIALSIICCSFFQGNMPFLLLTFHFKNNYKGCNYEIYNRILFGIFLECTQCSNPELNIV